MEPDFDRILSKKIRQTEQRPVSWNKQVVWQNVQSQTGTGRHHDFFYYVAAAMISLLIYFAVESVPNETKSQVTEAKMKSRLKPAESEKPVTLEKKQDLPDPTFRIPDNTAMVPVTEIPNSPRNATQPAQLEIQPIDVTAEPVDGIQITEEDLLVPEEVTVPEQKIRPVVGIITESYSETVVNVKQKKRLRKLEPSDKTPWENQGNALVFAMRK